MGNRTFSFSTEEETVEGTPPKSPSPSGSPGPAPSAPFSLSDHKITFTNLDEVPTEVLEHLLSSEIETNKKIEQELVLDEELNSNNLKIILYGSPWGRNVFAAHCRLLGDLVTKEERSSVVPLLRQLVVAKAVELLTSLNPAENLEGYMLDQMVILSDYPKELLVDVPPAYLDQTQHILMTLLDIPILKQAIHSNPHFHLLSKVRDLPQLFTSSYFPDHFEYLQAKSVQNFHGIKEERFSLILHGERYAFHLTDLSNIQIKRRRLQDQFENIDLLLYFVSLNDILKDVQGFFQNNKEYYKEVVNEKVFQSKRVVIVGYGDEKHIKSKNMEEEVRKVLNQFVEFRHNSIYYIVNLEEVDELLVLLENICKI